MSAENVLEVHGIVLFGGAQGRGLLCRASVVRREMRQHLSIASRFFVRSAWCSAAEKVAWRDVTRREWFRVECCFDLAEVVGWRACHVGEKASMQSSKL
jgi:hypothetical protein